MRQPYTYNQWLSDNQEYLSLQIQLVNQILKQHMSEIDNDIDFEEEKESIKQKSESVLKRMDFQPDLETLADTFKLSAFEKDVLLFCAGAELNSEISETLSTINKSQNYLPYFSLMMSLFDDAYWNAVSPGSPLRFWRLIRMEKSSVTSYAPLRIDESVLHYLTGTQYLHEKLLEFVNPVSVNYEPSEQICRRLNKLVEDEQSGTGPFPVVILESSDSKEKLSAASYLSRRMGRQLLNLPAYSIPENNNDLIEFTRLWNRESLLKRYLLYLDCSDVELSDKLRTRWVERLIGQIDSVMVIGVEEWKPDISGEKVVIEIPKPSDAEQYAIWQSELQQQNIRVNGELEKIVSQFDMSGSTIRNVIAELSEKFDGIENPKVIQPGEELWKICVRHTKPVLEGLAQRIEPVALWDDLVLPEQQKNSLKELLIRVRNRNTVYNKWGFASRGKRGLGITALFAGESGTGKTMASEVLANELKLELYKIDLSKVVNKYIGETEKNLKKIFDAAENGGAILLFDEADALFGKRSSVKDSHDRYSNIEVSYLLQRMEAYRGLAILTTNMKSSLDSAFNRRFSTIINFPFPDARQRMEIWEKIFPSQTPVQDLDLPKLSRFNIAGGNIRNIAISAAFLAANDKVPVQMEHIMQAAKTEYAKMEIPFQRI